MSYPEYGFMVIPFGDGSIKFMTYHEYIDSPEWRERVNHYKELAGRRCQECGATTRLTGHHRHYLNIGNEPPDDIEILCWPCHRKRHPDH